MNFLKLKESWKTFGNKTGSKIQNLSRAIVFPIAVLPIAGILLGIGGGFLAAAQTNEWGVGWINFFQIIKTIGNIIFSCLGILFASSIAFGFAKKSRGVAAVSAMIAFMVMTVTVSALFIPYTNSNGDLVVTFDPWKITGENKLVSVGQNKGMLSSVMGISPAMDLSVLGGIIVGSLTAVLHNKTYNIKVPRMLSFFGGEKFVPIAAFFMGIGLGIIVFFIWPMIMIALFKTGEGLGTWMNVGSKEEYTRTSGAIAAYFFGVFEQLLIPTGLHHVFYTPFWFTSVGGTWYAPVVTDGVITSFNSVQGAYTVFFEQMNWVGQSFQLSPTAYQQLIDQNMTNYLDMLYQNGDNYFISFNHYTTEVGTGFMSGRFAVYNYGLPAAGLAMIFMAKPENRKQVTGILGSAIITSMATGIIEPLIFSFIFVAPLLFGVHALIGGISYLLAYLLNVQAGNGFTAGLIDYVFFGLLPGYSTGVNIIGDESKKIFGMFAGRNGALWILIYGLLIIGPTYYFSFWALIKFKNIKTPGRISNENDISLKMTVDSLNKNKKNKNSLNQSIKIIEGLGTKENIIEIKNCASRLRVDVKNIEKINETILKETGSMGIIKKKNNIQIIYGPQVSNIALDVKEEMEKKNEE
ncbi:PTS transporter subunit EIIC [Spiroplasma taiwanense]|uniref:PTS system glucose-specific IIBC component n=1 Tax=Spiroplasma taiwanense CT-1 TaxID=1276220 RepID=S5MC68_9MOLU|nr:PTS transporter subunit EIIC [Spiroplasma taiwanense]AGR41318.1 PTS system glucose-specific IIBC component [Spiroplasma taiwanense CT-1]